jgi:ABC-type phosphate transport system permease subunit
VKLSKTLPVETAHVEKGTDAFFHSGLTSIPHLLFVWGKSLKTETQQLSWNLLYILMPFVALLVIVLFWIGHR